MTKILRTYYDHEPAYQQRAGDGRTGWSTDPDDGTFVAFNNFMASSHFPKPGIALDLGCGGGEIALTLADKGWQMWGTDYSDTALQLAQKNLGNQKIGRRILLR